MPGGFQVHIKVVRPWKFNVGQFVYLSIPGVSLSAPFQSHPFALSWWYKTESGDDIAVFLVQPKQGFTKRLGYLTPQPSKGWKAQATSREGLRLDSFDTSGSKKWKTIIEGPYGNDLNLRTYDTVLLFATGIGIAAQLPYVRQLLAEHYAWIAKTRRIALFWEMSSECKYPLCVLKLATNY